MNFDEVWKIRNWIYIACIAILSIVAFYLYVIKDQEYKYLTQFWPPDLVPHPNLPETLPSPLPPLKYA